MKYLVAGATHTGMIRSVNQDNYCCEGIWRELQDESASFEITVEKEQPWFMAVFDGMGGESDGELASLIAAELSAGCGREAEDGNGDTAGCSCDLDALISEANERICEEMDARCCRMGSTCVYLEFDEDRCRSWNVGDSRAYVMHDGRLVQLSEDHTEAASMPAIFMAIPSIRRASENRLTQHLGIPRDDFIIEPHVSEWNIVQSGDMLMICSDGLTHMADDAAICEVLQSSLTLQEKRDRLMDLALENGGLDNITILLAEKA